VLQKFQDFTLVCQPPIKINKREHINMKMNIVIYTKFSSEICIGGQHSEINDLCLLFIRMLAHLSMQIFSTCGTRTWSNRMMVCRGSLLFHWYTQSLDGTHWLTLLTLLLLACSATRIPPFWITNELLLLLLIGFINQMFIYRSLYYWMSMDFFN